MWPFTLSGRLLIVALVSRCLTNQLIRRGTISDRSIFGIPPMRLECVMGYYSKFPSAIPQSEAGFPRVTHPSAAIHVGILPKIPSFTSRSTCMC